MFYAFFNIIKYILLIFRWFFLSWSYGVLVTFQRYLVDLIFFSNFVSFLQFDSLFLIFYTLHALFWFQSISVSIQYHDTLWRGIKLSSIFSFTFQQCTFLILRIPWINFRMHSIFPTLLKWLVQIELSNNIQKRKKSWC